MKRLLLSLLLVTGTAQANIQEDIEMLCEAVGVLSATIAYDYANGASESELRASDSSVLNHALVDYIVDMKPTAYIAMNTTKHVCLEDPLTTVFAATTDLY